MSCHVITESTEALLGGQRTPVQLLFKVVDAHGQRVKAIPPLLSDTFVVGFILSALKFCREWIDTDLDPCSGIACVASSLLSL